MKTVCVMIASCGTRQTTGILGPCVHIACTKAREFEARAERAEAELLEAELAECRRALTEALACPLCGHEWRHHDPEDGRCDSHARGSVGACPCGRDLTWMQRRVAAKAREALASRLVSEEGEPR